MKVSVNGEYFEFDPGRKLMAEMLTLEDVTGISYGEWEAGLARGTARSLGALAWLLWRRDGRDVPWEGIASGEVELNLADMRFEGDEEPPDPTTAAGTKEASPSTGRVTSRSSPKSST